MPGPVSDSYDPEFGTGANAADVREGIREVLDMIGEAIGHELKPIVEIAQGGPSRVLRFELTERQVRLTRFGLNRALESI